MQRIASFAIAALLTAPLQAELSRTVIVVRHAERAGGMSGDVPISEVGRCRAEGLAAMLADAGVTAIYTSEVARTQQTAEPLARKLGLKPAVVAARDVSGLVDKLKSAAGTALVVGHSNTVPEIVKQLSGKPVKAIDDNEYDRMYVLTPGAEPLLLKIAGCAK